MTLQERSPPCVDDFLYICDDAYKREELISMEANILQTLRFDINIPIPYRFLRRYAKVCVRAWRWQFRAACLVGMWWSCLRSSVSWVFSCVVSLQCVSAGMDTLTLARYYCEMSLMEMELVSERGSLLASACLLMALVSKDLGGWVSLSTTHTRLLSVYFLSFFITFVV